MSSKKFFVKLKETCRQIDSDVHDIKMQMIAGSEAQNNEEMISKKICDIQDKINTMKVETSNVKSFLEPKLAHTRNFMRNFKELMAETEVSILKKEEYLKQYGYIPVESVPQVPDSQTENVTPDKKLKEDLATTPSLLQYGISSYVSSGTPELKRKSTMESLIVPPEIESAKPGKSKCHSDSTPTLDLATIISTSKPKETPPLPEPLYTPAKETPPVPDFVPYNPTHFPSTPKLNI